MKFSRFSISLMAVALVSSINFSAFAQSSVLEPYPSKPLRFIVPFPPGGGGDIVARMFASPLVEALGKPIVIDNKPGAQGNIGAGIAARSPADGYTILFGYSGTHTVNPTLYPEVPFKATDFQPLIWLLSVPQIMVIHPSVPAKTLTEFVELVKKQPDKFNFSSSGAVNQLAGELFNQMAGTKILHIPYAGGAAATIGLLQGEVHLGFFDPASAMPHVKSGKLRAIGVTSAKRSSAFPDLPTVSEAGVPGYEVTSWNGIFLPAGTPSNIVTRLNNELNKILKSATMRSKLAEVGYEPVGGTPDELSSHVNREIEKWGKIVKSANMKP